MKNPRSSSQFLIVFCSAVLLLLTPTLLLAQHTYTGTGLWTDIANWDQGVVPPDNVTTIINGTCEIAENIGAANTVNPGRITVGQGTTGVLNVTGGTLSGAHGGNSGIFVGEGAGGDGTVTIAEGAALRSQGATMNLRIGDDLGGVGRVTVAGELLNFKFFEIVNGTLEMLPTGINNKFNEATPSSIGANGILAFVIDGANVGALERSNTNGLQLTIDPAANLEITLGGDFAIDDSWTLISYTSLGGIFAQGETFTNSQGYTFDVDYGTGALDVVTLTLTSDDDRPKLNSFTATPASVAAGAAVQLSWDVTTFEDLVIDQGVGDVTAQGGNGSVTVNPLATTTYTLSATLEGVTVTKSVTVVVDELPEISSFTAAPATIAPGDDSLLAWDVSGATSITITGIGSVAAQDSMPVSPAATTTYTLTATNATGSVMADATVTVDAIAAALVHQYLAEAPGQTSGALLDGAGSSNFDIRNGDLRAVSGSDHTIFTQELGRANNAATDGGDNGDGFSDGNTFEFWVRTGELKREPQVIFDAGSAADGLAVLISRKTVHVIQSVGGIRTGDVEAPTTLVNSLDDFIQIVVAIDNDAEMIGLEVRGAAGGIATATGPGGGVPVGRASLFSWSGFGAPLDGGLAGVGDGLIPVGTTTFKGSVALLNVYDRPLSTVEAADAFSRWTIDVPVADSEPDGLPDFWEQRFFGDLSALPGDDSDTDTLTNATELLEGTDPTMADTDGDEIDDQVELADADGTDPVDADTDDDLLSDGEEINGDPSSDPLLADTDGDTFTDSVEVTNGSDPRDAGSVPTAFIGQAPTDVDQTAGGRQAYQLAFPDLDLLDATFRLCVDFDEKVDGERELLWETGGGGFGFSLTYEVGSQLALRASGNAALAEVFYTLSASQLAAGDIEVVFTYDVIDELDEGGGSTISLFVDGVQVGSDTDALGGDWSGTNNSALGIAISGIAGIDGGGDLTGDDFTSGVINFRKGFQFYSNVLFVPAAGDLEITAVSYDGVNLTITFNSVADTDYSIRESFDLVSFEEVTDASATGPSTTVSLPYNSGANPRVFLRVEQFGD